MLPTIVSAALSLGLALNAASPATARKASVVHAKYVTVTDGYTTKQVRMPTVHHYAKTKPKAGPGAQPVDSGCYEMNPKLGLVPCGSSSHPH